MTTKHSRTTLNIKTNEKRKSKPAKSISISFRVKPYVLAKALTGILRFNPAFDCDALSKIGKETFNQGLNAFVSAYGIEEISTEAKYILESLSDRIKLDDHDNLLATNRFKETGNTKGPNSLTQQMKEDEINTVINDRYGYDSSKIIKDFEPKNDIKKAEQDATDKINKEFEEKMALMEKERAEMIEKKTAQNIAALEKRAEEKENSKEVFTQEQQQQLKKEHKIQTEKQYLNPSIAKAKSMIKDENDPEFNPLVDDKQSGLKDIEDLDDWMKEINSKKD